MKTLVPLLFAAVLLAFAAPAHAQVVGGGGTEYMPVYGDPCGDVSQPCWSTTGSGATYTWSR